jgi:hypothetical protein
MRMRIIANSDPGANQGQGSGIQKLKNRGDHYPKTHEVAAKVRAEVEVAAGAARIPPKVVETATAHNPATIPLQ